MILLLKRQRRRRLRLTRQRRRQASAQAAVRRDSRQPRRRCATRQDAAPAPLMSATPMFLPRCWRHYAGEPSAEARDACKSADK